MDEHRRELLIDVALCGAMLAYGLPPTLDPSVNDPAGTVAGAFLLPALFVPVFLRRRHPLAAAGAFAAGCAVTALPTLNQFRLVVAVPVAVLVAFSLGFRAPRGRSAGGLALVLAGLLLVGATES